MIDPLGILEAFAEGQALGHSHFDETERAIAGRVDRRREYLLERNRDWWMLTKSDPAKLAKARARKAEWAWARYVSQSKREITTPAAEGRADHIDGGDTCGNGGAMGVAPPGRAEMGVSACAELSALHAKCTHAPRATDYAPIAKTHGTDEPCHGDTRGEHAAAVR